MEVKWTDNSTNEDKFIVERAVSLFAPYVTAGEVGFNTSSFVDNGAQPGTVYLYRVRASNASGNNGTSAMQVTTPNLGGAFASLAVRAGDIYYFAFRGPNRIERYDLVSRAWLPAFAAEAPVTALWADDAALYVAEGRDSVRMNKDTGARTPFRNFLGDVTGLVTMADILVAVAGSTYTTLDRTTCIQMSTFVGSFPAAGLSVAPALGRIFSRTTGVIPSNIQFHEIGPDGSLVESWESPYHGDYPAATRTIVFPNQARVVDNAGSVYSTSKLAYTNSLGGAFTDVDFFGSDIPIVLRENKLISYTNALQEAGSHSLAQNGVRVAVSGQDAVVFSPDHATSLHGLSITAVSLQLIGTPEPGQPINPAGLAYTPDNVFVDRDDNLLILCKAHLSLFRYSTSRRRYLPTLLLGNSPKMPHTPSTQTRSTLLISTVRYTGSTSMLRHPWRLRSTRLLKDGKTLSPPANISLQCPTGKISLSASGCQPCFHHIGKLL